MAKIYMQLDDTQQSRRNLDGVVLNMKEGVANIESQAFSLSGDCNWWKAEGGEEFRQGLLGWVQSARGTIQKIEALSRRVDHEQSEWVSVEKSHHYLADQDAPLKIDVYGWDGKLNVGDLLQGNIGFNVNVSFKKLFDPILPWDLRYPNSKVVDFFKGFTGNSAVSRTEWGAWDSYLNFGWTKEKGWDAGFFMEGSHWKQESLTYLFGSGLGIIAGTAAHDWEYKGEANVKDGAEVGGSVAGRDLLLGANIDFLGLHKYVGIRFGVNVGAEYGVEWKKGLKGKYSILEWGWDFDDPKDLGPNPQ
jgi:hypothetical protein